MEVLFSTNQANFYSALTHIAAHEKNLDEEWTTRVREDCKRVTAKEFKPRDVPGIAEFLGCKSGVEVFGENIFVDPSLIKKGEVLPGKFRQWLLLGASHQGVGGRRIYDTIHMNTTLALSYGAGMFVNSQWHRIQHLKYATRCRLPGCALGFFLSIPLFKTVLGTLGFNQIWLNYHMKKALNALECEECLREIQKQTKKDLKVEKKTKDLEKQAGMQTLKSDMAFVTKMIDNRQFEGLKCVYHK